jgi:hypothetical protein
LGKNITDNLKSSYTIDFKSNSSIAYLATSQPVPSINLHVKEPVINADHIIHWNPNTLMYGRLFQSGVIEGVYCRHFHKNWMIIGTAMDSWRFRNNLSNVKHMAFDYE